MASAVILWNKLLVVASGGHHKSTCSQGPEIVDSRLPLPPLVRNLQWVLGLYRSTKFGWIDASVSVSLSSMSAHSTQHSLGPSACFSLGQSVCRSVGLWQNGWADPDAVWGGEWCRSRDECIRRGWLSSKGKGQFWGWMWGISL